MRFFAILILILFYDSCNRYLERFRFRDFIIQCLLFTAVNIVKPNFIIAFAPAMLVMMIVDIIKAKGKGFWKWIMYGLPVLIGSVPLLFQYSMLFPSGTETAESSHVIFVLGDAVLSQKFPILEFLTSYAFPISVLILHRKELIRSKFHMVCCLGWFFSFLEFLFLSESGERATHGNFGWGLCFFTFLLFCLSFGYFINDVSSYLVLRRNKETQLNRPRPSLSLILNSVILFLHLISGLVYFCLIYLGFCAYLL